MFENKNARKYQRIDQINHGEGGLCGRTVGEMESHCRPGRGSSNMIHQSKEESARLAILYQLAQKKYILGIVDVSFASYFLKAMKPILEGNDVIINSETGSGKTLCK